MKEQETINAAAYFVRDDAGNLQKAGTIKFIRRKNAIEIEVRLMNEDAARKMSETVPPGGYLIVDRMCGGRLQLLTGDMDMSVPYAAITSLIDQIRERLELPLVQPLPVKPNPTKS